MNALLSPGVLLILLLSIGYASLFHLWGGRSVGDLLIYILVALGGFAVGQIVGQLTQAPLFQIGQVHLFEGSIGAWLAMILVREYRKQQVGFPT